MTPIGIGIMVGVLLAASGCFGHPSFDSDVWKAEREVTDAKRRRPDMIESLETDYLREGMTQAEIRALLGEPDYTHDSFSDGWLGFSGQFDVYFLEGLVQVIDYDTFFYVIEYNVTRNVTDFDVHMLPG